MPLSCEERTPGSNACILTQQAGQVVQTFCVAIVEREDAEVGREMKGESTKI